MMLLQVKVVMIGKFITFVKVWMVCCMLVKLKTIEGIINWSSGFEFSLNWVMNLWFFNDALVNGLECVLLLECKVMVHVFRWLLSH